MTRAQAEAVAEDRREQDQARGEHEWSYHLARWADKYIVQVRDRDGELVQSIKSPRPRVALQPNG